MGLPGPVLAVPRALAAAFPTRKGAVIGFATTGASAMSMVLVLAASTVINSYGWPTACLMFALTNMAAAVVALLSFDTRLAGTRPVPPKVGARPVGTTRCCRGAATGTICTATFALVATACNVGQLSYAAVGGSLVPCKFEFYAASSSDRRLICHVLNLCAVFIESGFSASSAALLAGPVTAVPNTLGKLLLGESRQISPPRLSFTPYAVLPHKCTCCLKSERAVVGG